MEQEYKPTIVQIIEIETETGKKLLGLSARGNLFIADIPRNKPWELFMNNPK
jgi:hypothetical protein